MKASKQENGQLTSVIVIKDGKEEGGSRTKEQLIKEGYKPLCEVHAPEGAVSCHYVEYASCIVQVWENAAGEALS